MNEEKAITLCIKHHDPVGFEYLFEMYRREAYFHSIAFLANHDDALDACQECFAKAFYAMPKLGSLKAFYPWFYSILRNHCINMLRKRNNEAGYISNESAHDCKDEQETPSFLAAQDDEQLKTWDTIKKLSPDFREILVMKYIEGLDYQKISTLLSIPRGTVMSRLYHARKAFKKEYQKGDRSSGGECNE